MLRSLTMTGWLKESLMTGWPRSSKTLPHKPLITSKYKQETQWAMDRCPQRSSFGHPMVVFFCFNLTLLNRNMSAIIIRICLIYVVDWDFWEWINLIEITFGKKPVLKVAWFSCTCKCLCVHRAVELQNFCNLQAVCMKIKYRNFFQPLCASRFRLKTFSLLDNPIVYISFLADISGIGQIGWIWIWSSV